MASDVERPTWEDVMARSQRGRFCCFDCYLAFMVVGWPCVRHATAEERVAIDAEILKLAEMPHPLLNMLPKG